MRAKKVDWLDRKSFLDDYSDDETARSGGRMKSKSEKFRELLEEEKRLRNQLMDCETAKHRMLKKAFNGLGLKMKIGRIGDMVGDESIIMVFETTGSLIRYFRGINFKIAPYEISVEDLFDAEVK